MSNFMIGVYVQFCEGSLCSIFHMLNFQHACLTADLAQKHPPQLKSSIKGRGAMRKQAGARGREPPTEEQRAEEERRRAEEERRCAEDEHRREVAEVQDAVRDLIRRLSLKKTESQILPEGKSKK